MTNLDSVLKNKDIILLSMVYIVKVVVFPVIIYRCENWTIKNQIIDAFESWCWTLESPVDSEEIKQVNPEGY